MSRRITQPSEKMIAPARKTRKRGGSLQEFQEVGSCGQWWRRIQFTNNYTMKFGQVTHEAFGSVATRNAHFFILMHAERIPSFAQLLVGRVTGKVPHSTHMDGQRVYQGRIYIRKLGVDSWHYAADDCTDSRLDLTIIPVQTIRPVLRWRFSVHALNWSWLLCWSFFGVERTLPETALSRRRCEPTLL